jgi:hypothetical protein
MKYMPAAPSSVMEMLLVDEQVFLNISCPKMFLAVIMAFPNDLSDSIVIEPG